MQPNDRPQLTQADFDPPKLYIMVDEKSFPAPGLETAFIDYSVFSSNTEQSNVNTKYVRTGTQRVDTMKVTSETQALISQCMCNLVTSSYSICVCNKMKPVCGCVGHTVTTRQQGTGCSCVPVTTGCSCAPVH